MGGIITGVLDLIDGLPSQQSILSCIQTILPFAPLLFFVWPLVLTVLFPFFTLSLWIFWFFTSLTFGSVQLFYVLYQFIMVGVDIAVLSMLKTFALVRGGIRMYTIQSGWSKKDPKKHVSRRGRKKEWRAKLESAGTWWEFQEIDIQEPIPPDNKKESTKKEDRPTEKGIKNPSKSLSGKPRSAEDQDIRRIQSCIDLDRTTLRNRKNSSPNYSPRVMSNQSLVQMKEQEQFKIDLKEQLGMTGSMLLTTTERLREARLEAIKLGRRSAGITGNIVPEEDNCDDLASERKDESHYLTELKFLLTGVVKRNHLNVDDLLINDSSSVMECGMHALSAEARKGIKGYHEEVERCLDFISENTSTLSPKAQGEHMKHSDLLGWIRKLKHNMGRSALMLSGGGAQAMYHVGTVKALCESGLYDQVAVISGTSGGSITAAMCAFKTSEELLRDVCVPQVSTDFARDGRMKRENIRWFPKVVDMGAYWMKHKLMVDSKEFKRTCDFYYGDITFEEAFERTGKHVCITVSASRAVASDGTGAQRLLLNHISTPHVTLASAVAASCALPGVMAAAKLVTKSNGKKEIFEVDGVEWIDGSVQADLPFKRISTLFNVSNYIVCQTNFHVVPFLRKAHHPTKKSLYWSIFQTCEWDIRNRALNLSRLGLFPKMFGHDISKVFKQKYHGNLTLVPRFTTMQVFGLKALVNPTYEDMKVYIQNGQAAAWPYVSVMREMLRLETAINRSINRLNEKLDPDNDWQTINDEVDSITSATLSTRLRKMGSNRETELLKQKMHLLELENLELKKQLGSVSRGFGISSPPILNTIESQSPTKEIEFSIEHLNLSPPLSPYLSSGEE